MWYLPQDAGTMLALGSSNVSSSLIERVNRVEFDAGPRAILSEISAEIRSSSYIAVEVRVENSGTGYLWGAGTSERFCDFVALRIFDGADLLGEPEIHFRYRMLLPGESLLLRDFFSFPELLGGNIERARTAGSLRIEVDLVRRGVCRLAECGASNGPLDVDLALASASSWMLLSLPLDIRRITGDKPIVALTFDGGSNAKGTPELLNVLREEGVCCTMFLTGRFVRSAPDLVRRLVEDGHEIANHTFSHSNLCFDHDQEPAEGVTEQAFKDDMRKLEQEVSNVLGYGPTKLWRAPYGHRNPQLLAWARDLGYQHIYWSINSEDWKVGIPNGITSMEFYRNVMQPFETESSDRSAHVVLLHLGSSDPDDPLYPVVRRVIRELRTKGYDFGRVSDLLPVTGLG
jgi:peptidoglycan-N-acetylmuramic acid deacetylase